ncbi:Mov34/MPN/PAD-1 family protein [Candidatus Bathyarchaeota archaeon]|nr:Mov34/MPN/PAD-1 family protein [Candidatus Bathyarchaeota archaeon]
MTIGISQVLIMRSVIESVLIYAKVCHPKEGILLLRGKAKKDVIEVSEVMIPPLSVRSKSFSFFSAHLLPMDFSIVGIAHSHPSGILAPSVEDLNNFYGRIMIIAAFP